jgi:hypothetical protein
MPAQAISSRNRWPGYSWTCGTSHPCSVLLANIRLGYLYQSCIDQNGVKYPNWFLQKFNPHWRICSSWEGGIATTDYQLKFQPFNN